MPTYKEQYDKIIDAYFRDDIRPYHPAFCFCGTIAPNSDWWCQLSYSYPYSIFEYAQMEVALLNSLGSDVIEIGTDCSIGITDSDENYEDALFDGMCAALEVLKQIHISRGEKIDEGVPVFTKRKLEKA